jgi:hypothetical protein
VLAVSGYEWFLFLHVLAAVVWAGGSFLLVVLGLIGLRARDTGRLLTLLRLSEPVEGPVFVVAGLVLAGFGFALVERGNWGYDHFFIQYGIAAWAVSAALDLVYCSRAEKAIERLVEQHGPEAPAVGARARQYFLVGTLDALLLLSAVFVMTVKPLL